MGNALQEGLASSGVRPGVTMPDTHFRQGRKDLLTEVVCSFMQQSLAERTDVALRQIVRNTQVCLVCTSAVGDGGWSKPEAGLEKLACSDL